MPVQVSPGLVQREIDLSLYVPALSTTNFAMVGTASKGEFDTIHEVGSISEYVEKLGLPTTPMGRVAQAYLRQGRLLKIVRVGDGNQAKASGNLPGYSNTFTSAQEGEEDDVGTYTVTLTYAPLPGTLGITGIKSADGSVSSASAWETDIVNGILTIKEDGVVVGSGTIDYTTKICTLTLTGKNVVGTGANRPYFVYTYGTTTGAGMLFSAKTEGAWGNNLKVKYLSLRRKTGSGAPSFANFGVYENDVLVETIQINKGAGNAPITSIGQDDVIEAFDANEDLSEYITATEPAGVHFALVEGDEIELSGGDDGVTDLSVADLVGTVGPPATGLQLFANPETIDVNLVACPYFASRGNGNDYRLVSDEDIGDGDDTVTPTVSDLSHANIFTDGTSSYPLTLTWTSSSTVMSVNSDADGDFSGNAEINAGAITEATGVWGTALAFATGYEPDTGTDILVTYYYNFGFAPTYANQVAVAMITLCESRGDCMALIDPPYGCTSDEVIDWHNAAGDYTSNQLLNSSYAALYWAWHEVYDSYEAAKVWVAPSGPASAIMAYTDFIAETWSAPAGLQRGKVLNSLDIEISPDLSKRELLLSSGSTVNAVNPFVKFKSDGIVLWGQKTLSRTPSALDRVNVRRLLLYAEKLLATVARFLVFEPNDEKTWRRFTTMAESVVGPIKARRGLYDFKVVCDSSTNTPEVIDQNKMVGKILLQPTKTAELIVVDWTLLSTGAEFTEYI